MANNSAFFSLASLPHISSNKVPAEGLCLKSHQKQKRTQATAASASIQSSYLPLPLSGGGRMVAVVLTSKKKAQKKSEVGPEFQCSFIPALESGGSGSSWGSLGDLKASEEESARAVEMWRAIPIPIGLELLQVHKFVVRLEVEVTELPRPRLLPSETSHKKAISTKNERGEKQRVKV